MSRDVRFQWAESVAPGDVLINREGHEMIVVEVLNKSTGDVYALYNGEVKLVNALRSSKIVTGKGTTEDHIREFKDAKSQS